MDDNSYKSLLPQNTDFVGPEAGLPPPNIPELPIEEAPAASAPTLTQAEATDRPKYPDREVILNEIGERIEGFFGFARVRGGRIQESVDHIKNTRAPMEILQENGSATKRVLQELPGSYAEEAAANSTQIATRAEQQIDDTTRTLQSIDAGEQLAYIKSQEGQFTGEALEVFKGEIREALKIEDPKLREDKLVELNNRIRALTSRVDSRANDSYSKSLTLQDGTKIRGGQIKSRLDAVQYVLPSLREKLGPSYHRVYSMADEMGDAFHRFGIEAQHIESISLEFKLLAHTADELGVSMANIFSALGAGKFI